MNSIAELMFVFKWKIYHCLYNETIVYQQITNNLKTRVIAL
nr:MAG TPA: hypothetical protein [Caudoviricetes sp.]